MIHYWYLTTADFRNRRHHYKVSTSELFLLPVDFDEYANERSHTLVDAKPAFTWPLSELVSLDQLAALARFTNSLPKRKK